MMRIVNLRDEIRDRELQPVGEDAACLVLRREPELGAEIVENVGDMRDDDLASFAIIPFMPRPAPRSRATST
jgi:hypothetical protein